ncbi:enterochelin esterase [Mangrovihabitans endophyticus]|uniref:Enterochelin esterase n=1 Tax=Mangrovihabitans endophyticus TaxID=1751298 RepID=A0A8J3FMM4_9ACTN|nr:enterochelin esterase [Mangrovihabitans endophyticus]GGK77151.1 enterochelin esterase [Mangrovihabitans endophyticus]
MPAVPPTSVPPRVPRPWPPPVAVSPRIEQLREAGPGAVADFWARIGRDGAPLVESDGDAILLTFLWRQRRPTRDVLVLVNKLADRHDLGASRMRRMPGTDLWHLTYRVRPDWQGSYQFAPDEDLAAPDSAGTAQDPAHWRRVAARVVADPLNPVTLPQERPPHKSVATAPAAAARPRWWLPDPAVPAGRVDVVEVPGAPAGGPRRVWRYRPPGDRRDAGRYPLLVLLDGDIWGTVTPVAPMLDNLIAAGRIPPVVALMPDSAGRTTRFTEYACHPGFAAFLRGDLIEHAAAGLRVTGDPARTVVAGQSLGGLAAAFAAFCAPERFGNVLSQSGAFWWPSNLPGDAERFTRTVSGAARRPVRWHLEAGLDEWVALDPNRRLRDALTGRGYDLTYAEFAGGHDRVCWRARFGDALAGLLTPVTAPG